MLQRLMTASAAAEGCASDWLLRDGFSTLGQEAATVGNQRIPDLKGQGLPLRSGSSSNLLAPSATVSHSERTCLWRGAWILEARGGMVLGVTGARDRELITADRPPLPSGWVNTAVGGGYAPLSGATSELLWVECRSKAGLAFDRLGVRYRRECREAPFSRARGR